MFTYRLRLIIGTWFIIADGIVTYTGSYVGAQDKARELQMMGYIDLDRAD